MYLFLSAAIGYLIGSIPSGFLLAKFWKGIDLRKFGSGSTGATNVLRTGDKKLAFLTLAFDAAKGAVIAVYTLKFGDEKISSFVPCICCMIGHVYPIWLRFKGGRGVATTAGMCLIFSPIMALISICVWALVAKLVKISSIASISFIGSFTMITVCRFLNNSVDRDFCAFTVMILIFIVYTHFKNISRLVFKLRP
jgi:glycerol-3-phosphate acyltransferase PlsY